MEPLGDTPRVHIKLGEEPRGDSCEMGDSCKQMPINAHFHTIILKYVLPTLKVL